MKKNLLLIAAFFCIYSCKKKDCFTPLVIYDLIFTDSEFIPVISDQNKGSLVLQSVDDDFNPIDEIQPEWLSFLDEEMQQKVIYLKLSDLAYESAGNEINKYLLLWPGGRTDTLLLNILYEKKGDCIAYTNIEHSINGKILMKHPDFEDFYYFDVTE